MVIPVKILNSRLSSGILCSVLVYLISCSTTPKISQVIDKRSLKDGTYTGYFKGGMNAAQVEVVIRNNRITAITVLQHDHWRGGKAEAHIPRRIVQKQATNVDAVSGATNSSHVIMNAAHKAIEKARTQN
ncbi:MAG: FMN-binding protein [Caldithrix sp.]|nr:FMN-binding protein [Caldithrix sp.]